MDSTRIAGVPLKILICGDRAWDNLEVMATEMDKLSRDTIIIHGNCRGADKMAGLIAQVGKFTTIRSYPTEWNIYKRAAGPIRNRKMYNIELPDEVWGFHTNISQSSGTIDMLEYAKSKNCKKVFLFDGFEKIAY